MLIRPVKVIKYKIFMKVQKLDLRTPVSNQSVVYLSDLIKFLECVLLLLSIIYLSSWYDHMTDLLRWPNTQFSWKYKMKKWYNPSLSLRSLGNRNWCRNVVWMINVWPFLSLAADYASKSPPFLASPVSKAPHVSVVALIQHELYNPSKSSSLMACVIVWLTLTNTLKLTS